MRPDNDNNITQEHAEPSMLKNGLRFLSRPLQATLLLSLASCVQPQGQMGSQWKYGRITPAQADAAQIQPPNGVRIVQPGTPISYQAAPRTRIAQPKPHSYPSHIASPTCMDGVHDSSTTAQYTPEQIQNMIDYYGSLYRNPAEAAKPMPAYAFQKPRYLHNHSVKSGETFSGICAMYNGLDRRVGANLNPHIRDKNKLRIGDVVQIPVY